MYATLVPLVYIPDTVLSSITLSTTENRSACHQYCFSLPTRKKNKEDNLFSETRRNPSFCIQQRIDLRTNSQEYSNFASQQINYMLGDLSRLYVTAFGQNYPL